jgi:TolB-like protein
MQDLIEAIRTKKLDRATAGYAVGAWLAVQAASIAAPAFAWPAWGLKLVILASLIGLPAVLLGTWTAGVRKESAGKFHPSRADLHVLALLSGFLLLLAVVLGWVFWPRTSAPPALPAPLAPANSLAVLPFANMSGDPSRQYFSDGVSDELINALSRVPSLRVAARTSSFAFAGKRADIKSIAAALGVRSILEGSVRENGGHIRIEASLVNASTGFAIWSERYDRSLTDILSLQDEIADAVVRSLRARLQGHQAIPRERSIDPEAYRLYLQAKTLQLRGNEDDDQQAMALLQKVTALAPDYASGFTLLGHVERDLADLYNKTEFFAPAQAAIDQALRLDPSDLPALSVQVYLAFDRWDWNVAFASFARMRAINPNGALTERIRAETAWTFNYPEEDIAAEIRGAELNPLSASPKLNIALFYLNHRQYDAAVQTFHEVLKLRHGKLTDLNLLCAAEAGRHNFTEARRLIASLTKLYKSDVQTQLDCPFALAIAEHDLGKARRLADAAAADALANGASFVTVGDAYRQIGDLKSAMPWYERAYVAKDTLLLLVPTEGWQTPEPLVSYPPWKELWSRKPIRAWAAARADAGKILGVGQ